MLGEGDDAIDVDLDGPSGEVPELGEHCAALWTSRPVLGLRFPWTGLVTVQFSMFPFQAPRALFVRNAGSGSPRSPGPVLQDNGRLVSGSSAEFRKSLGHKQIFQEQCRTYREILAGSVTFCDMVTFLSQ